MQHKDNTSKGKNPPFLIEHYTILLAEYENLEKENKGFFEEYEINLARQRQILKQIGAEQAPAVSKSKHKRMKLAYDSIFKESSIICELVTFLKNAFNLVDKQLYQEQLKVKKLEEQLRVIQFRNN